MSNGMGSANGTAPRRKSNVMLIVSLCLNLILVGTLAMTLARTSLLPSLPWPGQGFGQGQGQGLGQGHGHGRGRGQGPLAPHFLMRAVPAEAGKLQRIIDAHSDRIAILRIEAMDARHQVLRTFAAPDFSQQEFDRSLARVRAADAALEAEELKIVSESVAVLTPAERRAVSEQPRPHNDFGRHGRGGGRGF